MGLELRLLRGDSGDDRDKGQGVERRWESASTHSRQRNIIDQPLFLGTC